MRAPRHTPACARSPAHSYPPCRPCPPTRVPQITFCDSNTGKELFNAPRGRSWEQFVRECYLMQYLTVHLIDREDEIADILTHAIGNEYGFFKRFRNLILNHH